MVGRITKSMREELFFILLIFIAGGCLSNEEEGVPQQDPIHLIYEFSPLSGGVGTKVVIQGMHFSEVPTENDVQFNNADAEVIEAKINKLVVKVPAKARTGKIFITVKGITAVSTEEFIVQ